MKLQPGQKETKSSQNFWNEPFYLKRLYDSRDKVQFQSIYWENNFRTELLNTVLIVYSEFIWPREGDYPAEDHKQYLMNFMAFLTYGADQKDVHWSPESWKVIQPAVLKEKIFCNNTGMATKSSCRAWHLCHTSTLFSLLHSDAQLWKNF